MACGRCVRRIEKLEHLIAVFLDAYDASEMSNVQAAIDKFRKAMEEI